MQGSLSTQRSSAAGGFSQRHAAAAPMRLVSRRTAPSPGRFAAARRPATTRANATPLHVMITGPPAAGKGTQCARIVDKYGLVHISVGDLLRAEVAAGTPAGKVASARMDAGELVPNEVVVDMVVSRLAQDDARSAGWLLDGYPRSASQADAVEARGIRPDVFLLIDVPDEELVRRVAGRRTDPETGEIYHLVSRPPPQDIVHRLQQRSDDTEEAIVQRLKTHHSNVTAVVGHYKSQLVKVDGNKGMDEVFADIEAALDAAVEKKREAGEGARATA